MQIHSVGIDLGKRTISARPCASYTQDDQDEKQAAQGAFLSAVGLGSRLVQ
jgi:hypothetical protein